MVSHVVFKVKVVRVFKGKGGQRHVMNIHQGVGVDGEGWLVVVMSGDQQQAAGVLYQP